MGRLAEMRYNIDDLQLIPRNLDKAAIEKWTRYEWEAADNLAFDTDLVEVGIPMPDLGVLMGHDALQVLVKRFIFPINLIWKEKEWNDFSDELRRLNNDKVNIFLNWHGELMTHLPVFIRNLSRDAFVPDDQHGFYHLVLSIKQMRIHADYVEWFILNDDRVVAKQLLIFCVLLRLDKKLTDMLRKGGELQLIGGMKRTIVNPG